MRGTRAHRMHASYPGRRAAGIATIFSLLLLLVTSQGALAGFQPRSTLPFGDRPNQMTVLDLNKDGKLDIIATNRDAATVTVRLGNGDATFQAMITTPTMTFPVSFGLADLNGDQHLDLYMSSDRNTFIGTHLGNGDGTFQALRTFPTGKGANRLVTGDINGDGKLDIAVGLSDFSEILNTSQLATLLGNGDGTFGAARTSMLTSYPHNDFVSVILVDLNGDNKLDIATSAGLSASLWVALGNGDGTFVQQRPIDIAVLNDSITAAHFNRDGKVDLVTANATYAGSFSILFGNGDATFQSKVEFSGHSQCAERER